MKGDCNMPICPNCNIEKEEKSFLRKNGKRYWECYDCRYMRGNDPKSKASKVQSNNRNREKVKRYIYSYLKDNPCVDCGESDPVVLEFDHIKDKKFNMSKAGRFKLETVIQEMNKCQVRCANCHRRITESRNPGWKSKLKAEISVS